MSKLCPSAQPGMEGCRVLGVVQRDGPTPLLQYLNETVPATPEVLAMSAPLKATEVFRLTATCAEHHCPHFDGTDCRLATRIVQILPAAVEALSVHHPQRLPLVLAGGRSRMLALSGDHDRNLRRVAGDAGSLRTAGLPREFNSLDQRGQR